MRPRVALGVLLLLVAGVAVYVAGRQSASPSPPYEVQRLGPEPGERVADYLARARATLPLADSSVDPSADAGQVWALVQLTEPVDAATAGRLVDGVRLSRVVFRVPLPRVQTALVTRDVPGQQPLTDLVDAQRLAADDRAAAGARLAGSGGADPGAAGSGVTGSGAAGSRSSDVGRAAEVAAAESAALRAGCACVLAMLVRADGAGLLALSAAAGVRVVHAAEPGTPLPAIAVSPLLPEQTEVAGPVPDDGPVPTAPVPSR